jgi:vacuolar protein sorting-associated protein 35
LLSPIKTYVSLFTALALPNYIPLLHSQPYPTRRAVAGEIARSLMRNKTPITSVENLDSVLEILKVLIREGIQAGLFREEHKKPRKLLKNRGGLRG